MIPALNNDIMKNNIAIFLTIFLAVLILTGCAGNTLTSSQEMTINLDTPYAVIDGVDPNLRSLDVYAPSGSSDPPVVLMIHGGGWSAGDKAYADMGIDGVRSMFRSITGCRSPFNIRPTSRMLPTR